MSMERWKNLIARLPALDDIAAERRVRWAEERPARIEARVKKSSAYRVLAEGYPEERDENDEAWLLHDASRVRAWMFSRDWNWAAAVVATILLAGLGGWHAHRMTWTPPQQVVQWDCEVAIHKETGEREIVSCSGRALSD